jgi:hypothetical protein
MRYAWIALLLLVPNSVHGVEYLDEIESEVYQTTGTIKDISQKAKTCIAQIVTTSAGHELFLDVNIDSGTITANNVAPYTAMLVGYKLKGKLLFTAKENRFRMRHTNIQTVANAGDDYFRLGKWAGSGWKNALKALQDQSAKIAKCVQAEPKKEEW